MKLGNGLSYLAIPGPSVLPERVLRAMNRAAPNIYEGELVEMVPHIIQRLKAVARTRHNVAIFIANGHGSWEAAISNTLSRGDRVLVLATGRFAHGWAEMARRMGVKTEIMDFGNQSPVDPNQVTKRLKQDDAEGFKAVLAVHTDTSTSLRTDISAIRRAIDDAAHPALFMTDCIASLGCDHFEMDAWGVDVMVTASQKGLMTPPGLGFVYFNGKAEIARDKADNVTGYWDWRPRTDPDVFYRYFGGTAPTHHLYALNEALLMIDEEGLEAVWDRHTAIANAIWAAVGHWSQGGPLTLNISDRITRAHSVTALCVGSDKAAELRQWCETKAGLTLGIGLGMAELDLAERNDIFRLGHMGHVNAQMILGALATIEAGMKAVGIAHSPGGIQRAAEVIADRA